eukprot:gene7442-9146_t
MHEALKQSMPLLKELAEKGYTENAFSLFQVMERYYVPISEECYQLLRKRIENAVIEIAKFNDAISREEANPGTVPDEQLYIPTIETFNTLLNYYSETDKLPEAFRLFFSMKLLGVKPNKHTYRSLIHSSLRYEDIEVALMAYENMRSDGVVLEEQTYERLFESCCSSIHADGAADLYHDMIKNFNIPTINRMAYLTTLGTTVLMKFLRVPKSVRSGRGYVTSMRVSPTRFIFPPKHDNHILLEPKLPPQILLKLCSKDKKGGGLLPFN